MFKIVALVCLIGQGCIFMEETGNPTYESQVVCEERAKIKYEEIATAMVMNQIHAESLEVKCVPAHQEF